MTSLLQVETTLLPKSRIKLKITVPSLYCQENYIAAIERLKRDMVFPGFRIDKIPDLIVLQQIGLKKVNALALELLIDMTYRKILKQESINAIGQAALTEGFDNLLEQFNCNTSLTFIIETDVTPNPILKKTKGLEVIDIPKEYQPRKVSELLTQAQRRLANLRSVKDRAAQINDVAVIAFINKDLNTGDVLIDDNSNNLEIELDELSLLNDFKKGIIGMKIGDKKTIKCHFPIDYFQEEYRGRNINFNVLLKNLKVWELPLLNDTLAKKVSEKVTLDELILDLNSHLQKEANLYKQSSIRDALLNALVKELEVELPETLIQQEIHNLIENTASQIAEKGTNIKKIFTPEIMRKLIDTSRTEAEERLKKSLALKILAETEKISVKKDEIDYKVKEIIHTISNPNTINQSQLKNTIAADLLQTKLLDWLQVNNIT